MASEPTSPNELSQRVVISGKIAKSRRSKNSSKYGKHKERKRSPTVPYSDSESQEKDDGTRKCAAPSRPPPGEDQHSGYSSSNESSDPDSCDIIRKDEKLTRPMVEETELRKRNAPGVQEGPSQQPAPDKMLAEWEMVDRNARESDAGPTTGNESSDDFWKCDSAKPPVAQQKARKKPRAGSKLFRDGRWKILQEARQEWKAFKEEHRDEVTSLRLLRNRCAIGFLLVFIFCGIGGVIFHSVEGAFEMFYKCGVKRVKRDFLDALWSKSHYLREDEWKSLARSKLMEFENQLYDAYEAGMTSYSGQKGWSFLNSFVYCITIVTTIGE